MSDAISVLSAVTSLIAVVVAVASWRAAEQAASATIFDQRFAVYEDAEWFIAAWQRKGQPDMDELPRLVSAWNRSHFLFGPEVTARLRLLWTDAIAAQMAGRVIAGEIEGDHQAAVAKFHALLLEQTDPDKLRAVFMGDLKVHASGWERVRRFTLR
ncbi:MAG: hypothetical protein JNM89_09305 [Hyphomicrobiaceae bacterium]|nr:hypothetical protein [Hyphomicrobiaceae bacterium]